MSLTLERFLKRKQDRPVHDENTAHPSGKAGRVPWLSGVSESGVHADHRRI